jgi:PPOX class probable F420-dependent enzyme
MKHKLRKVPVACHCSNAKLGPCNLASSTHNSRDIVLIRQLRPTIRGRGQESTGRRLSRLASRCYMAGMSFDLQAAFGNSVCMNMRSFRQDGTPVDTPLWVVCIAGRLASYTDGRSFKAKRVRKNPHVEVAACDVWGRRSTDWYAATCRIVELPQEREPIFAAIAAKYGIHWKMSLWGSLLTNRVQHRLVMEFAVNTDAPL